MGILTGWLCVPVFWGWIQSPSRTGNRLAVIMQPLYRLCEPPHNEGGLIWPVDGTLKPADSFYGATEPSNIPLS
jgi:hypothetical protein